MTKMNEIRIEEMLMQPNGAVRERSFPTKCYTLYLDNEIGAPSEYRDHMEALESAAEWDEVRLVISSPGGRLDAGLMLINGIKACRAPVTAHIHDQCGSMATGIALACDNWMLGDFAYFFVHTASWMAYGKDSEIRSQVQFMDKRIDKFLHDMYDGFLSPEEISLVSKGQDMWINAEELGERLANYQDHREEQGCGNPECEGCGADSIGPEEPFDLKTLIKEAVAEALTENSGVDQEAYLQWVESVKKANKLEKPKRPSTKTKKALDDAKVIKENMENLDKQLEEK